MNSGRPKEALSPHADPLCKLCDEYGWVKDSEERFGWLYRCRHDPRQLLTKKPADVHEAARLIRAGRAQEEANPSYYRRAHNAPDPSEPRVRQ